VTLSIIAVYKETHSIVVYYKWYSLYYCFIRYKYFLWDRKFDKERTKHHNIANNIIGRMNTHVNEDERLSNKC
jgi:hypothetical protein